MSDQQPQDPNRPHPAPPGDYGQPAYGQPEYGQPGQPAYGQPTGYGYGQMPTPYGGYATQGGLPYASWGQRVVATLWDALYLWPGWVAIVAGTILVLTAARGAEAGESIPAVAIVGLLLIPVGTVLVIWRTITNLMLRQGRTGYTYGKAKVGVRVVRELDGQPAGVGSAVGRYFLHSIINSAAYIDYLWPLWDAKRQTITDKLLGTVVINQPESGQR